MKVQAKGKAKAHKAKPSTRRVRKATMTDQDKDPKDQSITTGGAKARVGVPTPRLETAAERQQREGVSEEERRKGEEHYRLGQTDPQKLRETPEAQEQAEKVAQFEKENEERLRGKSSK